MKLQKGLAFAVGLLLAASLAACDDPPRAERALQDAGMQDIQLKGYAWFGCGKDDSFSTAFTARNVYGRPVHGVVCSSRFKGATVRFF